MNLCLTIRFRMDYAKLANASPTIEKHPHARYERYYTLFITINYFTKLIQHDTEGYHNRIFMGRLFVIKCNIVDITNVRIGISDRV